jgi:GNAT superfamily N-acetyltransferase
MNEIRFKYLKAKEVELKYNDIDFPLVFNYLGSNRTHGDDYYELNWYEIIYNYKVAGLICLNFLKFKNTIHVSVFEIFEKSKGIGTKAMDYLFEQAKIINKPQITLQVQNARAKTFYLKLGFTKKIIDKCPYLIKYL